MGLNKKTVNNKTFISDYIDKQMKVKVKVKIPFNLFKNFGFKNIIKKKLN